MYLITPEIFDPKPFADRLARALDAGDVAAVQLRLKNVDDAIWLRAIDALRPVAQSRGAAFLLNDRADLVTSTGCDGVHVGQEDMPAVQARKLIGPDLTLGVTCKDSRDHHQGNHASRRPGNSDLVVRADGTALLRDRRH